MISTYGSLNLINFISILYVTFHMMIIPNIIFREAALVRRFRDPVRGFVSEGVAKAAGF